MYISRRYSEALVFEINSSITEIISDKIRLIKEASESFCGDNTCMPIFVLKSFNLEIEGFPNDQSTLIAYDKDAINVLMVTDVISKITYKRGYTPGQKSRRRKKKKDEVQRVDIASRAIGNISAQARIISSAGFKSEIEKIKSITMGFPFTKLSRPENRDYIHRELVGEFETRFPMLAAFDRASVGAISEMLEIMMDDKLYHHMHYAIYNIAECFSEKSRADAVFNRLEMMKDRARVWRGKIENGYLNAEDIMTANIV